MNPLFPDDDEDKQRQRAKSDAGYVVANRHGKTLQPLHSNIQPTQAGHTQAASHAHAAQPHIENSQKLEQSTPAVELIRRKLESLYADEPDAAAETTEATAEVPAGRSKHQQFMYTLSTSGKSLAEIQTAWHAYYVGLPDDEKQAVWQEFYANNNRTPSAYTKHVNEQKTRQDLASAAVEAAHVGHHNSTEHLQDITNMTSPAKLAADAASLVTASALRDTLQESEDERESALEEIEPVAPIAASNMVVVAEHAPQWSRKSAPKSSASASFGKAGKIKKPKIDRRGVDTLKKQITSKVNLQSKVPAKARQHLRSLAFGLSTGALVLIVVLFSFFNEVIIAPFIQPSRHASATPIILSSDDVAATNTTEVIIPKINVEIPVDYSQTSNDENTIENALENGIVHYPSTALPGQEGNAAFFGHSSNNIFNPGKYKFAFVQLHELVPGDIFYLTYDGKAYTYKVFDKQIVDPSNVSVLNNVAGKTATATLITCDPPGTSLHRLVVWGEQISPDPTGNSAAAATANTTQSQPAKLAGNGPTLWNRLTGWLF